MFLRFVNLRKKILREKTKKVLTLVSFLEVIIFAFDQNQSDIY